MKKLSLLALGLACWLHTEAQINVGNIVRDKVNQRARQKTEQAVDKSLDEAEKEATGKNKKSSGKSNSSSAETPASSSSSSGNEAPGAPKGAPATLASYSKFDFVPGDAVVFYDDYAADRVADFPARWNTNGSGEVVTTNLLPGKWLKLQNGSSYAPELKRTLPDNFTLEYDLIIDNEDRKGHQGNLYTYLISAKNTEDLNRQGDAQVYTSLSFYSDNTSSFSINNSTGTVSNSVNDKLLMGKAGQKIRVSIAVNGQRMRVYYDDKKIYDVPRAIPSGFKYNQVRFRAAGFDESQEYTCLLGNLRIAEGTPDVRSKLLTEGKLVTRGITFDSGSDQIKPESFGTLKEIGKVLADNPALKVKIVGHTDSDGADAANLDLSKKRAAAIKAALEKEFSIAANRMETDGKGEAAPAAPNTTPEGKANNRRVEFIKI